MIKPRQNIKIFVQYLKMLIYSYFDKGDILTFHAEYAIMRISRFGRHINSAAVRTA